MTSAWIRFYARPTVVCRPELAHSGRRPQFVGRRFGAGVAAGNRAGQAALQLAHLRSDRFSLLRA
jgi:hypothetical protein